METEKESKKQKGIDWLKKDMYEGIGRPDLKPQNFLCGKCEQEKLKNSGEKIPRHFKTCPRKWEDEYESIFEVGDDNQGILFRDKDNIQRAIPHCAIKRKIKEFLLQQTERDADFIRRWGGYYSMDEESANSLAEHLLDLTPHHD